VGQQPRSVLLVDDEVDVLVIFKKALELKGYSVCSFSNPIDAIERFREQPQKYALVISDIRMPGMNGYELVEKLKSINPNVRVLLMSAFELKTEYEEKSKALKLDGFLQKPIRVQQILVQVEKHREVLVEGSQK